VNTTLRRIQALRAVISTDLQSEKRKITFGELFVMLEPLEFALSGVIFSAPFLQPVPLPGLSTPLGLILAFMGVLTVLGHGHSAMPKRLRMKTLESETVLKILGYTESMILTLSRLPHLNMGRMGKVLVHPRALGAHIIFMSLLLALPLPIPFSNSVPAWGIVFACLAMIEANGWLILISYATLTFNLLFFAGLLRMALHYV
jgi:hypothetical protein